MEFNLSSILPPPETLSTLAADENSVNSLTLFVGLICTCIIFGHLADRLRWINQSIVALCFGLVCGSIILLSSGGKSSHLLEFKGGLFFTWALPPIVFNAGFQMRKKQFFRNVVTISLLGVVGSLICFGVITFGAKILFEMLNIGYFEISDYLAIGAIFSATDSVCTLQVLNQESAPLLYNLVFGESVVNDATSILIFNAILKFDPFNLSSDTVLQFFGKFVFLFTTSTLLGVSVGLLSAYIIRNLNLTRHHSNHSTDHEVSLMILMAYFSYIMAEVFNLSAILTVFFCGIVMSHYTWYNVNLSSRTTAKHIFATMSFIAETFIFIYVGMDALDMEKWTFASNSPGKTVGTSATLLFLVLVGRALSVFPISFLSNFGRRNVNEKISVKQMVIIWWAGLMRGAVSMGLAYNKFTNLGHTQQPGNAIMVTSTITVVLFSTVVFGLLNKPLIKFLTRKDNPDLVDLLQAATNGSQPLLVDSQDSEYHIDHNLRKSSLRMLLTRPTYTVHYYWSRFDDSFMRPIFGGPGIAPYADVDSPVESLHLTIADDDLSPVEIVRSTIPV